MRASANYTHIKQTTFRLCRAFILNEKQKQKELYSTRSYTVYHRNSSPSGHPRWVCFFIRFVEMCHCISVSAMDALQWMGAVRMRVQTADKNITINHTTPILQLMSCEDFKLHFCKKQAVFGCKLDATEVVLIITLFMITSRMLSKFLREFHM